LARPRCPLPANDFTVALHLHSVVERSKTFAPVNSASATIAFFQKVNLFSHIPTQSHVVGMVRQAAARKFGLTPEGRKEPFQWAQVVAFAQAYGGVQHQGYCHMVVASMTVIIFGAMYRHNDVSRLIWRNVKFEQDGNCFHLTFEEKNNAHFKEGNRVTVAVVPQGQVCPLKLLWMMQF